MKLFQGIAWFFKTKSEVVLEKGKSIKYIEV